LRSHPSDGLCRPPHACFTPAIPCKQRPDWFQRGSSTSLFTAAPVVRRVESRKELLNVRLCPFTACEAFHSLDPSSSDGVLPFKAIPEQAAESARDQESLAARNLAARGDKHCFGVVAFLPLLGCHGSRLFFAERTSSAAGSCGRSRGLQ